jgi:hypothetical protein
MSGEQVLLSEIKEKIHWSSFQNVSFTDQRTELLQEKPFCLASSLSVLAINEDVMSRVGRHLAPWSDRGEDEKSKYGSWESEKGLSPQIIENLRLPTYETLNKYGLFYIRSIQSVVYGPAR